MRILVTGADGQVGSALAALGVDRHLDLVALGRLDLDITDEVSIAIAFKKYSPSLVINAAAYTAVDNAENESELAFKINCDACALLANTCAQADIALMHISTDYVFDGTQGEAYSETDLVNPVSVYARSKEAGERAIREGLKHHIILRTSWVFGTQGSNFVKTIIGLAKNRDRLTVVADQFGGPSSAMGIAEVLLAIAAQYQETGSIPWGTYHYCQKPYVSWHQFADAIVDRGFILGVLDHDVEVSPIPSTEFPTPAVRPMNSKLDTTKLMNTFDLETGHWASHIDDVIKAVM